MRSRDLDRASGVGAGDGAAASPHSPAHPRALATPSQPGAVPDPVHCAGCCALCWMLHTVLDTARRVGSLLCARSPHRAQGVAFRLQHRSHLPGAPSLHSPGEIEAETVSAFRTGSVEQVMGSSLLSAPLPRHRDPGQNTCSFSSCPSDQHQPPHWSQRYQNTTFISKVCRR